MAGRPKTTLEVLPEDWYLDVLDLYKEGASDVEVKALLGELRLDGDYVSNKLFDRWIEDEPIFGETIKKGREKSQAWWERNGRTNLQNKDFNYTGWYMNMKNRFGWKDKNETEVKGDITTRQLIIE